MTMLRLLVVASVAFAAADAVSAQSSSQSPVLPVTRKPVLDPLPAHALERRLARPGVAPRGSARGGAPSAVVTEVERNSTIGFADSFAGQVDYDGNISPTGDTDVVGYELPFDAIVTFDMSAIGTFPNQDATMLIRDNAGQYVAYNDDRGGGSLWPLVVMPLPAGTYYCELAGVAHSTAGTYRLTVNAVPTTFATVVHNAATTAPVPTSGEVGLRLTLTTAARVNLRVTANSGQNLYLIMLRQQGSVLRVVSDGSLGTDPALDAHFPAGRYLLLFGDSNGAGGSMTINTTVTAAAVPPLPCGGSASGSGVGVESLALYSMNLGAPTTIDVRAAGTGASPMADPYLWIFDRNMNVVLHADTDGASPFPRIITPLPAGQYYLGVEPDTNLTPGTFQLTLACTPASPPVSRFGNNAGTIANPAETAAVVFKTGTPFAYEMQVIGASFQNPVLSVIDAGGNVRAFSSYAVDLIGNVSDTADLWVLVRDFSGSAGTFRIDSRAPNYFGGPAKGFMSMNDKAGRIHFPFASATTLPIAFPVPAPFSGNLLINVPLISLNAVTIPASGSMNYPAFFPNGVYYLQSLSLTVSPLGGTMTNVAR